MNSFNKLIPIPLAIILSIGLVACDRSKNEAGNLYSSVEVEIAQVTEEKSSEEATSAESTSIDESDNGDNITENQSQEVGFPSANLEEAGIHQGCIDLIEEIITADIENGFPSAQLAIVRDGKLVYEKGFGTVNAYNQDGTRKTDSAPVTTDTLYDLASISKMIGVNYALQKLVTDGELDINEKISDYLGPEFYRDTIYIDYEDGAHVHLDTIKTWKEELTIAHLLKHQGGFPPSPQYHNPTINPETFEYDPDMENPLYIGQYYDGNSRKTSNQTDSDAAQKDTYESAKEATIAAICKTPLMYEPGTKVLYSDVDYMILGLIVEKKTGKDLDTYLKETFAKPLGLSYITYIPLEKGFTADQCAATELNGNTRDGYVYFDGIRTETVQGQVHDEMAYYCMDGVSGHAGIFSNARDLAILGSLMIDGTYDGQTFFSKDVITQFTGPKSTEYQNWGLGWWRQGDMQRTKYFGTKAGSDTFGHQGWTGTLLMIDPEKKLVIAYLTNKINSPVINKEEDPNKFTGSLYTSSTLGFVPEILYIGLDSDEDITSELESLKNELAH